MPAVRAMSANDKLANMLKSDKILDIRRVNVDEMKVSITKVMKMKIIYVTTTMKC